MKSIILIATLLILSFYSYSQSNELEIEEIKKVIQTSYVEGLQNEGDTVKINDGFHPDFNLLGVDENDQLWSLSIKDWKKKVIKRKEKGEYPKTGKDKVSIKFIFVDVTGNAAVAKFEFYVGDKLKYIDYQTLYKFKAGWKIVSKTYHKM